MGEPPYYRDWLAELFGQPVSGTYWTFDFAAAGIPRRTDADVVELITWTLLNCGRDLAACDDWQVADGLQQIFNPAFGGLERAVRYGDVPFAKKRDCILAIRQLYADCFAPRCPPVLGHLSEPSASPLSGVCYMFWDVSALAYWERSLDREQGLDAVLEVLDFALRSPNEACVESALHGLGHLKSARPDEVESIIDRGLAERGELRPELRAYAARARTGMIL